MKTYPIVIARMLAFLLVILAVHWLDRFVPLYFLVIAGAAGIMLLSLATSIPGCRFLARLETSDRLAIWIVLVLSLIHI